MFSALAMVLIAAMTVPGDGPEKVSGEVEQGVDLRGEWKGIYHAGGKIFEAELATDELTVMLGDIPIVFVGWKFVDEGRGKLRIDVDGESSFLGIYRSECDHIMICCRKGGTHRPTSFHADGQFLLILHRVKPHK